MFDRTTHTHRNLWPLVFLWSGCILQQSSEPVSVTGTRVASGGATSGGTANSGPSNTAPATGSSSGGAPIDMPVTPPVTISASISPTVSALAAYGSQLFTCTVAGTTTHDCTWAITESGGGTISSLTSATTAVYVAPSVAGIYHVVATSAADPSATDTATVTVTLVSAGTSTSSSRLTKRPIDPSGITNTAPNGYDEYLPPNYDGSTPVPLIVFWHGIGEDGDGSANALNALPAWGPTKLIASDAWDNARPFIVLAPQHTSQGNGTIGVGRGCPSGDEIDAFITWSLAHYNVDTKRVYLTGLSCGAIGSWDYFAHAKGSVIAAAVLLSGNPGDPENNANTGNTVFATVGCDLGQVAIWSFHGDVDQYVPYQPDHDTMQELIACAAPPRRDAIFTDVVGGDHFIWDRVYDLSGGYGDIYAWMLANAKP